MTTLEGKTPTEQVSLTEEEVEVLAVIEAGLATDSVKTVMEVWRSEEFIGGELLPGDVPFGG